MLKSIVLLAAVCGAVSALTDSEWKVFKDEHGKVYEEREDSMRRMVYNDNLRIIQTHNEKYAKGQSTFYLGVNQFADMTRDEYSKIMAAPRKTEETVKSSVNHETQVDLELPATVDWVKKGYVTPVKNAGSCRGGAWAFATTGALEGQHFKATGKLVSLSESNLIDCTDFYGNENCTFGFSSSSYKYIIDNKGINTEESYPFVDHVEICKYNRSNEIVTMKSYKDVGDGYESTLQKAVANVGPIAVAVDARHPSFQLYSGGIWNENECDADFNFHAMLAVGYGTSNGTAYWLVRNSWGTSWGLKGYIKMIRNTNKCGIANEVVYPIV